MMSPSPEIDLLETLASQDEKLIVVLSIFGGVEDKDKFDRAKRVLQFYVNSGIIGMYQLTGGDKQIVPDWMVRLVLVDKINWINLNPATVYWVSLSDKGRGVFLEDSRSFFDELFGK